MFAIEILLFHAVHAVLVAPPRPLEDPAPKTHPVLERVVVLGASASSGFGALLPFESESGPRTQPVDLAGVLRASMTEDREVRRWTSALLFSAPMKIGPELLDRALASDPTLVVGADFLFWYGYGALDRDGGPIDSEDERLMLLEEGLAMLERVRCPLVVGDFPDATAAIGIVILPAQVPKPETLLALNERLAEWAGERDGVVVLPLFDLVATMRTGKTLSIRGREWPADGPKLLQRDQLHPTAEGLIAMVQAIAERLVDRGLVPKDAFRTDPDAIRPRIRPAESGVVSIPIPGARDGATSPKGGGSSTAGGSS